MDDETRHPPVSDASSTAAERRLPVYLLVEDDLAADPAALGPLPETIARLGHTLVRSFIYGAEAQALSDAWAECPDLGEALRRVSQSLEEESRRRTAGDPGDYPPLIFILASDAPEGDWASPALSVRTLTDLRLINVLGFGFNEAAVRALLQLTHSVFAVSDEAGALADCAAWIRRVTETTTRLAPAAAAKNKLVRVPAPPKTVTPVPLQL